MKNMNRFIEQIGKHETRYNAGTVCEINGGLVFVTTNMEQKRLSRSVCLCMTRTIT